MKKKALYFVVMIDFQDGNRYCVGYYKTDIERAALRLAAKDVLRMLNELDDDVPLKEMVSSLVAEQVTALPNGESGVPFLAQVIESMR